MSLKKILSVSAVGAALALGAHASTVSAATCEPLIPTPTVAQNGSPCGSGATRGRGVGLDVGTTAGFNYSTSVKLEAGASTQVVLIDSNGFIVKRASDGANCPRSSDASTAGGFTNTRVCAVQTRFAPVKIRIVTL